MVRKVMLAFAAVAIACSSGYAQDATVTTSSAKDTPQLTPGSESGLSAAKDSGQSVLTSNPEATVRSPGLDPLVNFSSSDTTTNVAAPLNVVKVETSNTQSGNVTLDFREADIINVLRVLAYKSGVNVVAGPEVTGLVTIQLTNVPWEQALRVILETYGYGYERRGTIIVVTTIENLKKRREDTQLLSDQEPLITKTFVLSYAKAAEAISSIDKMKTSRGSVNFDVRTNTVIVRDTQTNLDLISEIVPVLDKPTPQVLIEGKIIETTLNNTDKLGIDWTAKATVSGSKRPTVFPFENSETSSFLPTAFPAAASSLFSYGTIDFSAFQSILEYLKTRSDTNILSNPRITTLDNQKAIINVGTQYPIPTYTYNEQQAKLQISGWTYMDIGVIFEVTPHVNNTGYVTMDITPKVTAILDFVTVENTSLPRLSNESVTTRVMIKNGQTVVIAGLIKDQKTDTKKKVPILGDIPVLGYAFKKTETTVAKTDLLIFLTPHIITPGLDPADKAQKDVSQ